MASAAQDTTRTEGSSRDSRSAARPTVAVVGAGAMGVVTGYHFHLAGAQVVFVVKPERLEDTPSAVTLYSYDDASLKDFLSFDVIGGPRGLGGIAPDFVILTPDGAALASEAGRAMLRELGEAIRDRQSIVVVGAVGIGVRDLVIAETALSDDRVIAGLFAMLAHQVDGFDLPIHPPTDAALLAQADFAYRHLNEGGFLLETRHPRVAAQFVQLYDRCGIARCFTATPEHFAMMIHESAPINLLVGLGLPITDIAAEDGELWTLTIDAMRAILGLSEHGSAGALAAKALTSESVLATQRALEAAASPLDYVAFNARHHGVKVHAADVAMMRGCIAQGEAEGRDMTAARQLLRRLASAAT
ncbi:2-dehydropantoate 2-reductase N-terminal domain-containing protein [Pseudochelatococcus sp. B33]